MTIAGSLFFPFIISFSCDGFISYFTNVCVLKFSVMLILLLFQEQHKKDELIEELDSELDEERLKREEVEEKLKNEHKKCETQGTCYCIKYPRFPHDIKSS
jgi:hypothetical protein